MADRTLTFDSSFTVTVDGESVTSPYTLTKSCVIHASNPDGDASALHMNGETWASLPYPLVVEDKNISLTWIGGMVNPGGPSGLTINYEAASVPTPDWANCFVKTSSGNKAVEKVWIKKGSNLNLVWEAEETGINGHYIFNDILKPYPTATATIYLTFTRPPNTAIYDRIEFKDSEMWFYYESGSGSMAYDYNYNPDDDPNGWYGKNQEINITNSSEVDEVFTQWLLANTTKKS